MKFELPGTVPHDVEAMLLFGSQSRGDASYGSDIDVAVFTHAKSIESLIETKRQISLAVQPNVFFSVYSLKTVECMALDGSLFLWHLKREGRVLFQRSGWVDGLLLRIEPYSPAKALRDISTFESVLGDIGLALKDGHSTLLFEAATLFSILRSLGMIVSMSIGLPNFGRWEPICRIKALMGSSFALSASDLDVLHSARLLYGRGFAGDVSELTSDSCKGLHAKIADVANFARRLIHESLC